MYIPSSGAWETSPSHQWKEKEKREGMMISFKTKAGPEIIHVFLSTSPWQWIWEMESQEGSLPLTKTPSYEKMSMKF